MSRSTQKNPNTKLIVDAVRAKGPEGETKRQKFLRIGQYRVVAALHTIRLIGNLAATATYEWKPEDVALIQNTLQEAMESTFAKFSKAASAPKLEEVFNLADTTHLAPAH